MPTKRNINWARYLRDVVPGDVSVTAFYDDDGANKIDMFSSCSDGGVVGATLGLASIAPQERGEDEIPTEILIDSRKGEGIELNVLATAAFYVIKDGWKLAPGVVFENLVSMYVGDLNVKHLFFVAPFQWDDKMSKVSIDGDTTYPLLAVHITVSERDHVLEFGPDSLEQLWEDQQFDVLDFRRESVI